MGKDKHEAKKQEPESHKRHNVGTLVAIPAAAKALLVEIVQAGEKFRNGALRMLQSMTRDALDAMPEEMDAMYAPLPTEGNPAPQAMSYFRSVIRKEFPDNARKYDEAKEATRGVTNPVAERTKATLKAWEDNAVKTLKTARRLAAKMKAAEIAGFRVDIDVSEENSGQPIMLQSVKTEGGKEVQVGYACGFSVSDFLGIVLVPGVAATSLEKKKRNAKQTGQNGAGAKPETDGQVAMLPFLQRNKGNLIATLDAVSQYGMGEGDYAPAASLRTDKDVIAAAKRAAIAIAVILGEPADEAIAQFPDADDEADGTSADKTGTDK